MMPNSDSQVIVDRRAALAEIWPRFADVSNSEAVLDHVEMELNSSGVEGVSFRADDSHDESPHEFILRSILRATTSLLCTAEFHILPGILGPAGSDFLAIFYMAECELVQCGHAGAAEVERQRHAMVEKVNRIG